MRVAYRFPLAFFLAASAGCKVDPPDGGASQPDAGGARLTKPQVSAPQTTPLETVAIRGRADGATRIVIKNVASGKSSVNPLLPGGDFCTDTPLPAGAVTTFRVIAVAENGTVSDPVEIDVQQDPAAPQPIEATCSGGDNCASSEDCSNNADDDCNGFKDDCDGACNGCDDDGLEPNDTPFVVPMVAPATYPDLAICPCREDWFGFLVLEGGTIDVKVKYPTAEIDIDLQLYEAAAAEAHSDVFVAESSETTGTESIVYTSTGGGAYYLRIFSFRADEQGSYTLTVN